MDDIKSNKANFLAKHGFKVDVQKSKDVLGKESISVRDVLNGKRDDKKIDKMSDIFPQTNSEQNPDDLLS